MEKTWKRKASRIIVIEKIMDNHARALPKVLRSKTKGEIRAKTNAQPCMDAYPCLHAPLLGRNIE